MLEEWNVPDKEKGGDWIVNGTTHFISHADIADFVIVFIATGKEETKKGKKKKISCFLVDRGTPDFKYVADITLYRIEDTKIAF